MPGPGPEQRFPAHRYIRNIWAASQMCCRYTGGCYTGSPPYPWAHIRIQSTSDLHSIYKYLHNIYNYLHNIYTVLGIKWQPTPVFLPGEPHRWRSLVGYSPWGCKELDTTERLHFHFPLRLSCNESTCNTGAVDLIPGSGRSPGGGNGNPLQHSCLENLMDRGAWQATVHGVAKESDTT